LFAHATPRPWGTSPSAAGCSSRATCSLGRPSVPDLFGGVATGGRTVRSASPKQSSSPAPYLRVSPCRYPRSSISVLGLDSCTSRYILTRYIGVRDADHTRDSSTGNRSDHTASAYRRRLDGSFAVGRRELQGQHGRRRPL
jgi:hypothetical protein